MKIAPPGMKSWSRPWHTGLLLIAWNSFATVSNFRFLEPLMFSDRWLFLNYDLFAESAQK